MLERSDTQTIGETAYRQIRTDIVFGKLAPGIKLKLERLRADYGVSVGTLRELLSRLVSDGFVVAEGQRGFEVAPVTAQGLREIAELRLLLEQHALTQSFRFGDMEWEGRIVAAHHKLERMERKVQSGETSDEETWKRYDFEFHHALISACGSETLLASHAPVFDKYLRYLIVAGTYRGEVTEREHRALLKSALDRDAKAACETLRIHIEGCVEFTLKTTTSQIIQT
ncbi:HTH-type transcriptional repressor CsiR [Variibacter gotjawalensis]|uniref:HTH-type transcriptional repressor CsiR n=1 Tax=Variibacter gotjawalensis TaxID=1333996 RepID=A0A0S3PRY4_9BRAD|nr:GntR family transcriptional regulator [Variibacter gotjawalensis]NIK48918.1 DNA-binding GntR family transcriptional regulator [Variibacter gotjawalensis]RZS50774.1 GntR family transcriptional regulator [Variibacter gotjawalensis]BAT58608.1 HTH-type transcriptional repressor CsiR [Variibacter gotjawalensis]